MHFRACLLIVCACLPTACGQQPANPPTEAIFLTNTPQPTLANPATATPESDAADPPDAPPPPTPVAVALLPGAIGPTFPPDVDPLTGQQVDDLALLDRRPIVTKISNAPPLVRPQAGIGMADIVYEHYAEGGLTRFSAVFYRTMPERVGSIRSARLIDFELVPMYQALLVYSGASSGVNAMIDGSEFVQRAFMGVRLGAPYYFRDEAIEVPHNLFANLNAVSALAREQGQNGRPTLEGMVFHPDAPPGSVSDARVIDIRYIATRVVWRWDAEKGKFLRFSDGEPHFDALTEQQVSADNVVVLFAQHDFTDIVESEWQGSKSYSIQVKLWFEGDAMLFRDGKRYDVRWWRPTREGMLMLVTADGKPVYMKPGNTWFQVVRLPEQQDPAEEGVTVE